MLNINWYEMPNFSFKKIMKFQFNTDFTNTSQSVYYMGPHEFECEEAIEQFKSNIICRILVAI